MLLVYLPDILYDWYFLETVLEPGINDKNISLNYKKWFSDECVIHLDKSIIEWEAKTELEIIADEEHYT